MNSCDVAIIGAGPYGLSLAAHLKAAGVDFRVFGSPMEFWLKHMPQGMHLKSEGFASSLYDPGSTFTLEDYCRERDIPYAHAGVPVPREVFCSYGLEFHKRFVPEITEHKVVSLQRSSKGFQLTLQNGDVLNARRVVVAVGLSYYQYIPPELAALPESLVTHSSRHTTLEEFKDREVAVVGAGASAIDLAALLHQAGVSVHVIARVPAIRFHDAPNNAESSWINRLRAPATGIGPGWKLFMCAKMPLLFRLMPEQFRIEKVRKVLGPAPCWFTKEQVVGKVKFTLGVAIKEALAQDNRVTLRLLGSTNSDTSLSVDHVIAATGYKPNVHRLTFLDPAIIAGLRLVENSPALSSNFESTMPNLYFIGVTAANTFGPLLRFAYGAGFAAPRLAKHLTRTAASIRAAGGSAHENVQLETQHSVTGPTAG